MIRGLVRAALVLALVVPSGPLVARLLGKGPAVLGLHVVATLAAVLLAERWLAPLVEERLSRARAHALAGGLLAVVGLAFLLVFPLADRGSFGGGSDADEAYDLGVRALAEGRSPYGERTYLGNLVHPLPGGLLLAWPLVAVFGTSAGQSLVWLAVYLGVLALELGDLRRALPLLVLLLAACPAILHAVVTGTDGVMNPVSVLAGLAGLVGAWGRSGPGVVLRAGSTGLFALALANRPNFLLALVPAFAALAWRRGLARAAAAVSATLVLVGLLTVPLYLHDPAGFAPLEAANRLTRLAGVVPYPAWVLPGAAAILSVVLACRPSARTTVGAAASVALGQALLVGTGHVVMSVRAGALEPSYAGYGLFVLLPGALAAWAWLRRPAPWAEQTWGAGPGREPDQGRSNRSW